MLFNSYNNDFIPATSDSILKRLGLFSFTVITWWLSDHYLRPSLGGYIQVLRNFFGNGIFIQNVFSQSLPVDLTCLMLFLVFYKLGVIPPPKLGRHWKIICGEGFFWGLIVCIPTVALALQLGYHLGFAPNWQSILGNVISNSYEEFTYRIFLFSIACYAFRKVWIGILISALLFASIHTQYPFSMQVVVGIAAVCFSSAYVRSKSIYSAILSHELADAILDSILVR